MSFFRDKIVPLFLSYMRDAWPYSRNHERKAFADTARFSICRWVVKNWSVFLQVYFNG